MIAYLIRRFFSAVAVILPPGDFTDIYKARLINQGGLTEAEAERMAEDMKARYGLDAPIPLQYPNWLRGIISHREFGYSFRLCAGTAPAGSRTQAWHLCR